MQEESDPEAEIPDFVPSQTNTTSLQGARTPERAVSGLGPSLARHPPSPGL